MTIGGEEMTLKLASARPCAASSGPAGSMGAIAPASARAAVCVLVFFFQAEDGIRDYKVTGVQTCALPIFDLLVELVDDLGRRAPGRADAEPGARLVAGHPVAQDRHVRQNRGAGRGGHRQRSEERRVGKECRSRWSPYH